jgi:putative PIN family toxin of toxin-antitoxin system
MHSGSRIVVDTNVLISRALIPGSVAAQALSIVESLHLCLVSEATMKELAEVLLRPKFAAYITSEQVAGLLARLDSIAETVPIIHHVTACRDPKDDKFLDVAINGNANGMITGDADLLALHPFRGVHIMTPRVFIESH